MAHHTPAATVNGLAGSASRYKVPGVSSRQTLITAGLKVTASTQFVVPPTTFVFKNGLRTNNVAKVYHPSYSLTGTTIRHLFNHKVEGIVQLAGSPVQGAEVALFNKRNLLMVSRTKTDAGGAYSFSELPATTDPHVLVAFHPVLGTFNPAATEDVYSVPM